MREDQFQEQVIDLCKYLRLRYYHTHDSRRSVSGFPDLVIVGKGGVIYIELKSEKGKVSTAQQEWIDALVRAGQRAYVVRPSMMTALTHTLTALSRG